MQSSRTNEESIEQDREQNGPLKGTLLRVDQTGSEAIPNRSNRLAGSPHRFTLPFIMYTEEDAVLEKQESSLGLLRRARLISYSDVEQEETERPPVAASLPKDLADADTTPSIASWTPLREREGWIVPPRNAPHKFFSSLTEEQFSLLDTAMMASVRPPESGAGYTEILVDTLIEDITKQATLGFPRITQGTEHAHQLDQRKDITAAAGGAAIAGISELSSVILRFVTNVMMTHMVSPTIFGIFGEIYTIILILGWIAKLGFEGVLLCLLPVYRVKEERNLAGGLARFTTWIILLSSSLIGAFFFAFAAIIARQGYNNLSYRLPLQEASILIPLLALQLTFASGLQAFKEIKLKVLIDRLSQPVITLIALVVFYLLGWRMEALIFSAISGFFCSVLIGQLTFSKVVNRFTTDVAPKYTPWVWTNFAVPMFFNGLIYGISNSCDILFLSIFASPVQTGTYIVADRVSNFVTMPLFALNMFFSPLIAEYHVNGKHEQLANMLKLVTKWSLTMSLPIFLCCLVFHNAILEVFGTQYTADWLILIILCFGNLVNTGTGSVLQLLTMTRRLRIVSINSIITLLLNLGLSFMLIPHFNSMGAAIAATLAVIINNVLCLVEVYWLMKIHPYRWDICKPFIAGGAASLVGYLLLYFFQPGSGRLALVEELGLIIPFILVYSLVMVLLRFSIEDKIVFDAVRAKYSKHQSSNQLRNLSQ